MKKLWNTIDWTRTLSIAMAGALVVLLYLLINHLGVLFSVVGKAVYYLGTFLVGLVIAYVLSPLTAFFGTKLFGRMPNRKAANSISVVLTYLVILGILALILWKSIPQLADSISTLVSNLDRYYATFERFMEKLSQHELAQRLGLDLKTVLDYASKITDKVKDWLENNVNNVGSFFLNIGQSLVNILISVVISVYILLDWNRFRRGGQRLGRAIFRPATRTRIAYVAQRSDFIFKGFVRNNLLDALIIGLLNLLVMLILGMPYATLISFLVGLTNIIPTFGPIIGYVPSALILVLINPWQALWFTVLTVVLQSMDSSVIKPMIFKDAVGLPPLWVLVSIIVGGRVGGILGMLLAMPVTGILAFLLEDFIKSRLAKKGEEDIPLPSGISEEEKHRRELQKLLQKHKRAQRKRDREAK